MGALLLDDAVVISNDVTGFDAVTTWTFEAMSAFVTRWHAVTTWTFEAVSAFVTR